MEETIEKGITETAAAKAGEANKGLEEMMRAGLHFGHKSSKTHPKMKPYIAGVRNTIHILNLEKTREKMEETLGALAEMLKEGKVVLLVGTRVQVKNAVRQLAQDTQLPFVTERWIGGLFTNFEEVSKRIAYLKELEGKKSNEEEWKKYTKWERHEMEEQMKKLEEKFGGVKRLEKLPDALFVFDLDENGLAVKEAKQKGIPVFAVADTNCDPSSVDYAIPANDDAISSVAYLTERVKETILENKSEARSAKSETSTNT